MTSTIAQVVICPSFTAEQNQKCASRVEKSQAILARTKNGVKLAAYSDRKDRKLLISLRVVQAKAEKIREK